MTVDFMDIVKSQKVKFDIPMISSQSLYFWKDRTMTTKTRKYKNLILLLIIGIILFFLSSVFYPYRSNILYIDTVNFSQVRKSYFYFWNYSTTVISSKIEDYKKNKQMLIKRILIKQSTHSMYFWGESRSDYRFENFPLIEEVFILILKVDFDKISEIDIIERVIKPLESQEFSQIIDFMKKGKEDTWPCTK